MEKFIGTSVFVKNILLLAAYNNLSASYLITFYSTRSQRTTTLHNILSFPKTVYCYISLDCQITLHV